ncbi:YigZ family protein [bacterium]|nr:YigZ family protein [bacterium]
MDSDQYQGIEMGYSAEYKQLGSKFLGFIHPVRNREEAEEIIKEYRNNYSDATHVCTAYVLGVDRDFQMFNDDGEPSNSAGRPILNALLSSETTFITGLVVRYYGGKKLGVPGLIEAYGAAINLCLEQAEIKDLVITKEIKVTISPNEQYKLFNFLNRRNDISHHFNGDEFIIECSQSLTGSLLNELKELPTLAVID